jgi:hypothetical protein
MINQYSTKVKLTSVAIKQLLPITISIALLLSANVAEATSPYDSLHKGNHEGVSVPTKTRQFNQFNSVTVQEFDPITIAQKKLSDSTAYHRSKALEYSKSVANRNAYTRDLHRAAQLELPIGLVKEGGDLSYTIIIKEIEIDPAFAILEAYVSLVLPQTGDTISFRGKNLRFTYDGGFTGVGRLELLGAYPIKLNDKTLLTIVEGNTFIDFDCNGFKGMGLEAEVEFSRDIIIPEDEKGRPCLRQAGRAYGR